MSPDNCVTAQTCAPATDRNLESDCVKIRPSSTAQEIVPFSHTSAHGGGACCYDNGTRESPWVLWYVDLMDELCAEAATAGNESGSAARSDRTSEEQLMRRQTTIDAERAARTPVNPAQDARTNLVDLRVGHKPETVAGETHEWKSGLFKMRQHISAVDDEDLYRELVKVEANPLREMPLAGMNEPQKRRPRQLALHADDAQERLCTPDRHQTA